MSNPQPEQVKPKLPFLAHALVRYILGFGVSVAVGLAPYLGRVNVPLFTPLLALMPASLQNIAIPVSASLMGLVAVGVQWYGSDRVSREWSRQSFSRTLYLAIGSLLTLIVVHPFAVATVKIGTEGKDTSFVVGLVEPAGPRCAADPAELRKERARTGRDPDCNPCAGLSPDECLPLIGTSEDRIKSHWGSRQIAFVSLLLLLPYLAFMSSFGLLVGLLLLEQKRIHDKERDKQLRAQKAAGRKAQKESLPAND